MTNWRRVENDTGLDLHVPNDAQAASQDPFSYVVVAVTTLPHFKSPRKHKRTDVVQVGAASLPAVCNQTPIACRSRLAYPRRRWQFAVKRTHKEFSQLCEELLASDQSLSLPEVPKRSKRQPLAERTESLSRVVMFIAKEPRLCVADATIRFLGFNPAKVKREYTKTDSLFAEEDAGVSAAEGEEEDLFGAADTSIALDPDLAQDLDELESQLGVSTPRLRPKVRRTARLNLAKPLAARAAFSLVGLLLGGRRLAGRRLTAGSCCSCLLFPRAGQVAWRRIRGNLGGGRVCEATPKRRGRFIQVGPLSQSKLYARILRR